MSVPGIVLQRRLSAPPSRVFRAWTDPDLLAQWMSPVGRAIAEVDLRPGGALRVVMVGDGIRIEHEGIFLAVEPPHRLIFTWRSEYTGSVETRVTVELAPSGRDTILTLRHELLAEAAAESHAGGWGRMLDRLATLMTADEGDERGTG